MFGLFPSSYPVSIAVDRRFSRDIFCAIKTVNFKGFAINRFNFTATDGAFNTT